MWMTFHGAQWPYYPRTGIGVSGYGWIDNSYQQAEDRRALGDVDCTRKTILQQGRILLRVTPTYSARQLLRPGAGGDRRQQGSVADAAAAGHRRRGRCLGAHRRMATVGPDVRPLRGVRDLLPRHGLSTSTRRSGWARSTRTAARPTSTARPTCSIGRAAPATSRFTSIRIATCASSCSRSTAVSRQYNEIGGRPAVIFDIGWLKLKAAAEYQWLTAKPERDNGEQRNWGFAGSAQLVFTPYVEGGINYGFAEQQRLRSERETSTAPGSAIQSSVGLLRRRTRGRHRRRDRRSARGTTTCWSASASTTSPARTSTTTSTPAASPTSSRTRRASSPCSTWCSKQLFVKLVGAYAKLTFREGVLARARLQRHDVQRASARPVFVLKLPAICSEAFRNRRCAADEKAGPRPGLSVYFLRIRFAARTCPSWSTGVTDPDDARPQTDGPPTSPSLSPPPASRSPFSARRCRRAAPPRRPIRSPASAAGGAAVERRGAQPAGARVGAGRFGRQLPDRPRRAAAVVRLPRAGDPRPLRQLALARHAGPPVALLPAHRRRRLRLRLGRHRVQAHAHRRPRAVRSH